MARSFKAAIVAAIVICVAGLAMAQGGPPSERGRGMWGDGPSWGMGPGLAHGHGHVGQLARWPWP